MTAVQNIEGGGRTYGRLGTDFGASLKHSKWLIIYDVRCLQPKSWLVGPNQYVKFRSPWLLDLCCPLRTVESTPIYQNSQSALPGSGLFLDVSLSRLYLVSLFLNLSLMHIMDIHGPSQIGKFSSQMLNYQLFNSSALAQTIGDAKFLLSRVQYFEPHWGLHHFGICYVEGRFIIN